MTVCKKEAIHPAFAVRVSIVETYNDFWSPIVAETIYKPGRVKEIRVVAEDDDEMIRLGFDGSCLDDDGEYLVLVLDDGLATFRNGYAQVCVYDPNGWEDGGRIPKQRGWHYGK